MAEIDRASFSTCPEDKEGISRPESSRATTSKRWFEAPLRSNVAGWVMQVHEAFPSFHGALAGFPSQYLQDYPIDLVTYGAEMERLRETRKALYASLGALPEDEEEFGRRSWYVGKALDEFMDDPKNAITALSEVLLTTTSDLGDDARTAALRYASSKSAFASSPELLTLCFSSLDSDIEQQAMAAARTLGDLGEPAIIPQMRGAMKSIRGARVKEALRNSVKEIEQAYGVDKNSP